MAPKILRVIFKRGPNGLPTRYAEIVFNADGGVINDIFVNRGVPLRAIRRVDAEKLDIAVKNYWLKYYPYRLLCGFGTGYGDD